MNVYLLVRKIGGIITKVKAFIDYKTCVQALEGEKEFYHGASLYTINIEELDDKIKEFRRKK